MQVSQLGLVDSHAVIGGGEARAFQMSDSAEFFTVLSSTLYRDKKRAVVREVVCNAWDAHIVAGKTDVPVDIKLTESELSFKDFGPGIHDDLIADIYCTYGGSTKTHDGKQTGGFGLGSKAPFAYSDHFTVTSCHDGVKSVYAVSRGGVETGGRPGIRRMVCVPTTESGITVSIQIRDETRDLEDFGAIIRSVVLQGGINATLNDCPLPRNDYSELKKFGFTVLHDQNLRESSIYVLYGSVLYPVSTTERDLSKKIRECAPRAAATLVIHAPANSIGITPSRESISYTEPTKKVISELITRADRLIRTHASIAARKYLNLNLKTHGIKGLNTLFRDVETQLADCDFLTRVAGSSIMDVLSYEDISRIAGKEAAKFYPRYRGELMRRSVWYNSNRQAFFGHRDVAKKILLRPYQKIAFKADVWQHVYMPDATHPLADAKGSGYFPSAAQVRLNHAIANIHDEIVVARGFGNAARKINELRGRLLLDGRAGVRVFTIINRKLTDAKIAEIQALAKRFNLTAVYAEARAAGKPKVKTPTVFHSVLAVSNENNNAHLDVFSSAEKIADPNFYFAVAKGCRTALPFYDMTPVRLAKKFCSTGAKVAVAATVDELAELQKRGAKPFILELVERCEEMAGDRAVLFQSLYPEDFFPGKRLAPADLFAVDLARVDERFAEIIFGIKLKDCSKSKEFREYRDALKACHPPTNEDSNRLGVDYARIEAILVGFREKALKVFAKPLSRITPSSIDFVEEIHCMMDYGARCAILENNKKRLESLLTIIRALKRENIAKSKNTNALKEAA